MKIVITGGHTTPALAVIEALPKGVDVVFIGRKHTFEADASISFEYEEVMKRGIVFYQLPSARLQRSISRHTLRSLFRLPNSIRLARKLLKEISPDVVLSFGGYIGLPVVVAAATLKIPSVIHEQTTRAGFANKFSSRFVEKVCISWESSREFFPLDKTILTGNPLRTEILETHRRQSFHSHRPRIYITGGSAGSHFLNILVERHLKSLLSLGDIVHQVGDATPFHDYERLVSLKATLPEKLQERYHLHKFLFSKEASLALASSDLVIGRSGINTISELIYFEKPTLCIPLATGQKGEQEENAALLTSLGLGRVLLQKKADELFVTQIQEMLATLSKFRLSDISLKDRFVGAAGTIVSILSDVEKQKTNKKT